ncbi:MAG: Plug domain-containing protein, partial [Muribaculaceae bacterium]|nr:Plug domain-containing protein [Muribaculaceae bacterium]
MILVAVPALNSGAATLFSSPDTTATTLAELEVKGMRGQSVLESTAPTHTIDATQIRTSGITDISDAMRRMPGVNLRDYGGSGGMKTVSVRGLGAQHTGVIYDGAMLGDIQGGQIDLSRYSLENLSSLSLSIGDADDIYIPARAVSTASTLSVSTLQNPDMMSS